MNRVLIDEAKILIDSAYVVLDRLTDPSEIAAVRKMLAEADELLARLFIAGLLRQARLRSSPRHLNGKLQVYLSTGCGWQEHLT